MLCSKAALPYVTEGFIFKGRRIVVVETGEGLHEATLAFLS